MKRLLILTVAAFFLLPSLFSCTKEQSSPFFKRTEVGLFDTVCTFGTTGPGEDFTPIADALFEELARLDLLFDCYEENETVSNLATVNAMAGIAPVKVDALLIDFFLYIDTLPPALLEKVHPVTGALTILWKNAQKEGVPPSKEALHEASAHINYRHLVIDAQASTLYLTDPAARLDVGAFAKGFAAKHCAALLADRGVENYLLDLGGNISAKGYDPRTKKMWTLGVDDPAREDESALGIFPATDCTLSTTAGDKRFFVYQGKNYHHVIDPATLFPADSEFLSVTVCAADPALADALSTTLFILPKEEGQALIKDLRSADPTLSALYCKKDGTLFSTEGFPKKEGPSLSDNGILPALLLLLLPLLACVFLLIIKNKARFMPFVKKHPDFFSKRNLLFLGIVLLLCILLPLLPSLFGSKGKSGEAVIRYRGQTVKTLPLKEDCEYLFSCPEGENMIVVEGGKVFVSSADCQGGDCVKSPPLDESDGLSVIACLPHNMTVTVKREGAP
ncbi:MAG: FAD:protein FMN transferase [Clostridia bacterium]|nr:FAD:protein FMN transferase [Clostridia bacterium]